MGIRRNPTPRMEYGASNCDHADEDEVAHHMEDETIEAAEASCYEMHNSPSHRENSPAPSMHEDVAANNFNALVAYQAPEYRGEPLSSFEREVLHRMETLSTNQRTYFDMTQARFQHLEYQIEGVQYQLSELYYKHK